MKKIFVLLIVFFFVAYLAAQENTIPVKKWETSSGTSVSSGSIEDGLYVTSISAATIYSDEFEIFNGDYPKFEQELSVVLKIDSLTYSGDATKTDVDSIVFFPMFWMGQSYGYFTGDTINWSVVSTDASIDSVDKLITLPDMTGKTLVWKTTPTISALGDTAFVQNVAWEKFQLMMNMIGDSSYFNIACDVIIRQTK